MVYKDFLLIFYMLHELIRNRFAMSLVISVFIAIILSALFLSGFLFVFNKQLGDKLYAGSEPLDNIAIVSIDDKSLQEIGRWPWDRDVHARLLEKIKGHAAIAAFDISFFEPSDDDAELDSIIANASASGTKIVLVSEYTSFSVNWPFWPLSLVIVRSEICVTVKFWM